METLETYRHHRRIICYIRQQSDGKFVVYTGKPSDISCLSWIYDKLQDAQDTAREYARNYKEAVII